MKHLKKFNESKSTKGNPKYKVGQRLVLMDSDPEFTFPLDGCKW